MADEQKRETPDRYSPGGDEVYQYDAACPGCVALIGGLRTHARPEAKDRRHAQDLGAAQGNASMLGTIVGWLRAQREDALAQKLEAEFSEKVRAMLAKEGTR